MNNTIRYAYGLLHTPASPQPTSYSLHMSIQYTAQELTAVAHSHSRNSFLCPEIQGLSSLLETHPIFPTSCAIWRDRIYLRRNMIHDQTRLVLASTLRKEFDVAETATSSSADRIRPGAISCPQHSSHALAAVHQSVKYSILTFHVGELPVPQLSRSRFRPILVPRYHFSNRNTEAIFLHFEITVRLLQIIFLQHFFPIIFNHSLLCTGRVI